MNEYPDVYNPHTYHISATQSVFLKLKGNFLRVSHTRSKIPKKSVWNEPELNVSLTHHRIYNLLGAKISILPDGLARGKYVLFNCVTFRYSPRILGVGVKNIQFVLP